MHVYPHPLLTQVFRGNFYMVRFGAPSLKRHLLLSNWQGLVETLVARAGYLSAEDRQKLVKIRLAVQQQNRSKVKSKFTGIPKLLKSSQLLGRILKHTSLYSTTTTNTTRAKELP